MAPEASEEVEIVPAAPDPDPEQQQATDPDVTTHQDYSEGTAAAAAAAAAAKIKEVLSEVQPLRERISQVLGPAGPHRVGVLTGDNERHCLAFMETELTIIAAFLTTLSPQHYLEDGETKAWLKFCSINVPRFAVHVLGEVNPSRHTLLRRASLCFHHSKSYSYLLPFNAVQLYYTNEHPSRHRHHLLPSSQSQLGLITPPQLAEPEPGALLPLVGIDRPAKKIFRWLALAHQGKMDMNLRIMWIVGPVGIGKTTLAVELRNRIRQHETSGGRYYFQCNVMAQASRGTERNILLLQDILSQVSKRAVTPWSSDPSSSQADPSSSQAKAMKALVRLVSECLRDKRYLVIIDDIWEASDWEKIKGAFPNNNLDSRILVTIRSTSIAWACCSDSYDGLVHEIKPLSETDSQILAKAVGSVDGCLPNNMKLHCDEMLRRCDDIPLFIIGMADWLKEQRLQQLHQREDEDEERQGFPISFDEQVPRLPERLEQALSSAFNDFPDDDSRLVLLYMSMFPYGYKFEKDGLILKWMHEGLIRSGGILDLAFSGELLEVNKSEAETIFSQLVDRNVINCVASNCKHNNLDEAGACKWQVNHFMQKFLASRCAEMGFIFTTTTLNLQAAAAAASATITTDRGNQTSSRMPRRLALHHPDPQLRSLLKTMDLSQTRSLAVSGTVSEIPLQRFVNLVVLDFEGWENLKDEDLLQVCRSNMFFLRYLSVRNTRVSKLPHEVKKLHRLWAQDVSYTLIGLGYLDLRGTQISQLPKQIVALQGSLKYLLVETAARLPHDVWHLYQLHTLATVDLTKYPASFVRALGGLSSLRVLAFTWSFHQSADKDSRDALLSSIRNWKNLESLTIHCGLGCSMEFLGFLEKYRAPQELKKFNVTEGRFASVPRWIDGLRHLAYVQITVCKQVTDDLKILGDLPKLQCLILGLDFIPGQAIVIENEGFGKLQRLSVDCPMPWLTFQAGSMQRLTHLQLKFSLGPAIERRVPSGITNLPRISEVVLSYSKWCANSTSVKMTVKAVKEQVAKHRNPIDLFINGVEDYDVQTVDEEAENATGTSWSGADAGPRRDDGQAVDEEATGVAQTEITEAES